MNEGAKLSVVDPEKFWNILRFSFLSSQFFIILLQYFFFQTSVSLKLNSHPHCFLFVQKCSDSHSWSTGSSPGHAVPSLSLVFTHQSSGAEVSCQSDSLNLICQVIIDVAVPHLAVQIFLSCSASQSIVHCSSIIRSSDVIATCIVDWFWTLNTQLVNQHHNFLNKC